MKHSLRTIALFIFFIAGSAQADIAVLVHGYHSSGNTWRYNGITHLLGIKGWQDAGFYTPQGRFGHIVGQLSNDGKYIITAELPSEAPVEIQANLLTQYLNDIKQRFAQQKIHLIAHSSGGIVSRLALVNNYAQTKHFNVEQLITIATPHFGSPIAEMADMASDSPIGIIAPLIGANEINRAETLYKQLSREKENYFLFWLNRQPHPPMKYTSIVRGSGSIFKGDWLVPPSSQNMSVVPAIGPKAHIIVTPGDHNLKYADGFILSTLLP